MPSSKTKITFTHAQIDEIKELYKELHVECTSDETERKNAFFLKLDAYLKSHQDISDNDFETERKIILILAALLLMSVFIPLGALELLQTAIFAVFISTLVFGVVKVMDSFFEDKAHKKNACFFSQASHKNDPTPDSNENSANSCPI